MPCNKNNANTQDDVYSAVVTRHDKGIAQVHPVHLMNVKQRQAAVDAQTKPTALGR